MKRSCSVDEATVQMLSETDVVTVAVWGLRPTALWPGARIHLSETSLGPMMNRRRCVFSGEAPCDGFIPVLDRILRSEGTRCWVCCPLQEVGRIAGTLTLGSEVPGAISPADEPYLRTVAALFEQDLVEVGRQADRELSVSEGMASGW